MPTKPCRAEIGIPAGHDILEHINNLPAPDREGAFAKVRAIETAAMPKQTPQPGLVELMDYVDSRGLKKALCTRNFEYVNPGPPHDGGEAGPWPTAPAAIKALTWTSLPVNHLLTTFLPLHTFSPILTRSFRPPKPDPAGILHIASQWNIPGEEGAENLIMVHSVRLLPFRRALTMRRSATLSMT